MQSFPGLKKIPQHPWTGVRRAIPALVALLTGVSGCGDGGQEPPPPPASLAFMVQPSNVGAGAPITPGVKVAVHDASGNVIPRASTTVTLELLSPTEGTLLGTTTATPVDGIATFSDLWIERAATDYRLVARSGSLSENSAAFMVSAGPIAKLAFVSQPTSVAAGAPVTPGVRVAVQDALGNVIPSASMTVTLELVSPTEGTLLGTTTATSVNGIATFSNLSIERAASGFHLVATSGSLSVNSAPFAVRPATPAKLAFVSQPTSVEGYRLITPGFQVAIQDAFGNATTSTVTVNIAIAANPGGATLTGRSVVNAREGIATWRLRLDAPGNGYTVAVSHAPDTLAPEQLTGATSAPFSVTVPPPYTAIAAAAFHACGIISGEGVHCWGQDDFGQVGDGTTVFPPSFAVPVIGATQFVSVSVGYLHSCGLTAAGAAFCWGRNFAGMLGDGTETHRSAPVAVAGNHTFAAIAAGGTHGCGLKADGSAYCWGFNESGTVGDGTLTNRLTPVAVSGGVHFAMIAAGDLHNCGLTSAGAAYCWGWNIRGPIGDGTLVDRTAPVPVAGGLTFTAISPGSAQTCGLIAGGTAYCWGANSYAQLGDGSKTDRTTPVPVSGGLSFQIISTGSSHTCGLTGDGTAYCWGYNGDGSVGDGTTIERLTPTLVAGGLKFSSVVAGASFSCGVATTGVAYCWGGGFSGQLGNDSGGSSSLPVRVVR